MEIQGPKQLQLEDYIEIVLRRKWFVIIPFVVSIIGIIVTLLIVPRSYKSTTMILVEHQKVPESYVNPTVTADINERLNTITQQVMSRTRLESIINEFGLYNKEKSNIANEELVGMMRGNIEIDIKGGGRGERTSAFSISYVGSNPETVMHVTNRLASLFIEENLKVREQQAEGTTEFLDSQMQGLKAALETHEMQIKLYKEKYMGELPSQTEATLRTLDRLQMERKIINDELSSAEERKNMIQSQLAETRSQEITTEKTIKDPQVRKILELEGELTRLSSSYTDKYPDIVRIKREISEIKAQIKTAKGAEPEENNINILSKQLVTVNKEIVKLKEEQENIARRVSVLQGRIERIPARELQIAALMRDYENTNKNYQSLLNKKLDAQLAENLEKRQKGEQFKILDPANLPVKPFKPDPKKIVLMGIALGAGAGAGLVVLLEVIDASFRKPDDVYAAIGIPVLASLPRISER